MSLLPRMWPAEKAEKDASTFTKETRHVAPHVLFATCLVLRGGRANEPSSHGRLPVDLLWVLEIALCGEHTNIDELREGGEGGEG